ncbi:ATP-binding cassette domain-containing protein [Alphaproteobacteria bacterium HT1-32]|nr:ATP-binding cassette domain-containing protein [Alphaproteobacteria bacterium HT1-32]|tara:strand:- start:75758 stop:76846 length:1089 start_codon:yes stop_codon:yes gene_type:complete
MTTVPTIALEGLTKRFGNLTAVDSIDLQVSQGELVSLLGPSGCGKTTTLSMVAGFLDPDGGDIRIEGNSVIGQPPSKRNAGMVFQSYALFPHMSAFENVAFGLRVRKLPGDEIDRRVNEALGLVRLDGLGERMPRQLSGGQQQRVAIARALVYRPGVLLLDEPFSNLDAKLRVAMRTDLVEIQKETGITALFVTHDQEEAMHISDRVVVMHGGRIEQVDAPSRIYRHPTNRFVADFLGDANLVQGSFVGADGDFGRIALKGNDMIGRLPNGRNKKGDDVWAMIRPEHITMTAAGSAGDPKGENRVAGIVRRHAHLGASHIFEVEQDDVVWRVKRPDSHVALPAVGDPVDLTWRAEDGVVLYD